MKITLVRINIEDNEFLQILANKASNIGKKATASQLLSEFLQGGIDSVKFRWQLTDDQIRSARKRARFITKNSK